MNTTDIRLVAIDETSYWRDDIAQAAGQLWGVYVYDAHDRTYCCELTPSRLLVRVYTATRESVSEDVYDLILEGNCESDSHFYMHVSAVEKLIEIGRWEHDPDESSKDNLESAREWWQGNPPI
jgi:hypothetical protein